MQVYPVSTAHVASHPSPAVVPESSQYPEEGTTTIPSPHKSEQLLGLEESPSVHFHPVSTAQDASQPSPVATPPSSQYPAVGK